MRTRPRAAGWRASSRSATRPAPCAWRHPSRAGNSRSRWTCASGNVRRVSSLPIELTAGGAAAAELLRRAGAPEPGCHDELRDGEAQLRAPWRRFAQWLPAEGLAADLERRGAALAAQIRTDGVTHNVYGAEGASTRPWSLELLPLMVEPADRAAIERGVAQRASLLDDVLADVYG